MIYVFGDADNFLNKQPFVTGGTYFLNVLSSSSATASAVVLFKTTSGLSLYNQSVFVFHTLKLTYRKYNVIGWLLLRISSKNGVEYNNHD